MIVVVDSGVGNLGSILNMLRKIGADAVASGDPETVAGAERLVLPGVGAFDAGMERLAERGLIPVLERKVLEEGTPVLGVCLGMQLLTRGSEEGSRPGLGWIDARTIRFRADPGAPAIRVPHMGWSVLRYDASHPLLAGLGAEPRFYFAHSYHVVCDDPRTEIGWASHAREFPCIVGAGNVLGVQFHPEKSHRFGLRLLENFARSEFAEEARPVAGTAGEG
jgi:imidazole glycerol-phosphate synthase subunit HisH